MGLERAVGDGISVLVRRRLGVTNIDGVLLAERGLEEGSAPPHRGSPSESRHQMSW